MTLRENGAPQESKKVVLDIFTVKLLGASRRPERQARAIHVGIRYKMLRYQTQDGSFVKLLTL